MYTEEQKEEMVRDYFKESFKCPFCKSESLDYENSEMVDDTVLQNVACLECEEEWIDRYDLNKILLNEHDPLFREIKKENIKVYDVKVIILGKITIVR